MSKNEWLGYPDPSDPDNFWIDDETGERVNAHTGERTQVIRKEGQNVDFICHECGCDLHDGECPEGHNQQGEEQSHA